MDYQEVIEYMRKESHKQIVNSEGQDAYIIAISAIQELQEYKQLGTLEEVREAVEKQRAKKPYKFAWVRGFSGRKIDKSGNCPQCGCERLFASNLDYCRVCGQHIDWREEE